MNAHAPLALFDLPAEARPAAITTRAEARHWLRVLHEHGLAWHPEDDPRTVGNAPRGTWVPLFTAKAAARMEQLMAQTYATGIDPCAVLLRFPA